MKIEFSKFREVVARSEFGLVWIVAALLVSAFIVDFIVITGVFLLSVQAALLFIILVLVFVNVYRTTQIDRGSKMERSELAGILESMDEAIIVYQEGFRAIFFNPAAEQLFHIPAKSVVGHVFSPRDVEMEGWRMLIQVVFPSLAPKIISRSKEGDTAQVVDLSFTDPQYEFRVTTAPLVDDQGNITAFIKIIRNRTAEIAAIKSKSEFVTVASHQLRGPVTDVNWALESIASAPELTEDNKNIVKTALEASQGLLRRIEDLLSIAKMEDGEFGYNFQEMSITDFISKVLADVLPAAQKAGIKIYFDRPSEELPHVFIDPKQLSLAVVNLLENAIRYNVQNGEVIIKTGEVPEKPFVMVSVKDSGIGIPPEAMPKLFDKFYRAENAMKVKTEGSGLGLYIARGVIRSHGGEIWVESELNRGTTMTFTLPTDPSLVPKHEVGAEYLL